MWHDSSPLPINETHLFNPDNCNTPEEHQEFEDIRYQDVTCYLSDSYNPYTSISATYLYPTWGKITPEKVDNYLQTSSHQITPAARIGAVFLQDPTVHVNALVDTGATQSLINRRFLKSMLLSLKLKKTIWT